ncbi:MAG: hypothetical protein IKR13_05900 [Victivallales bacterium]|nr:hypothetical protein [Victivallales bacterium]
MKVDPRPLLALQAIDLEIFRHQELLEGNAVKLQECDRSIVATKQEIRKAEQSTQQTQEELRQAEQSLKGLEENRKKFLMQSASIKKNDEYQVAMAQIAKLDDQIGELEGRVLELLQKQEEIQAAEARVKAEMARQQVEISQRRAGFLSEKAQLEKELSDLQTQRIDAATAVEPALLKRYEVLRSSRIYSKRLPALVSVDGGVCARCHRQIPNKHCEEARHGEIATCEGCAALLYSEAALQ